MPRLATIAEVEVNEGVGMDLGRSTRSVGRCACWRRLKRVFSTTRGYLAAASSQAARSPSGMAVLAFRSSSLLTSSHVALLPSEVRFCIAVNGACRRPM